MVFIPKKQNVVKTVPVKGAIPKGIWDKAQEALNVRNAREGDDADIEFLLPYILDGWADELHAENEREAKKRKDAKDNPNQQNQQNQLRAVGQ